MSKIGCNTITWGDITSREQFFHVMQEVKDCGYDAVETGVEYLTENDKQQYDGIGLKFLASHICPDLKNSDTELEIEKVKRMVPLIKALGGEFLFVSALNYQNKAVDDYKREAEIFNRFGEIAKGAGIVFCYHNHHFEFKKQRLGLNILVKEMEPELVGLLPDIGWVTRGDMEPVDFLKEFGDRVKAIHCKEFTFDDHFTELGKGIVDLRGVYEYVKERNLWMIAEQDTCNGTAMDSAKQNAAYLLELTR